MNDDDPSVGNPSAVRRVLTAEEGEALLKRLAEPAREPTAAMRDAVRRYRELIETPAGKTTDDTKKETNTQ